MDFINKYTSDVPYTCTVQSSTVVLSIYPSHSTRNLLVLDEYIQGIGIQYKVPSVEKKTVV